MAKVVRRNTLNVGNVGSAVGAISAMKPRPPSSPRSGLLGDITNGATGLLAGKAGAEHEVARLSSKVMDLMSQVQAREAEKKQLQQELEVARKEAANAKAMLNVPACAPAAEPAMQSSSSRARIPAPRPVSGNSPARKEVMVRVLSTALKEADAMTALKSEELAAARAMLAHRSRGPSPSLGGAAPDAPAPGVVAKLQADLAEAAEERRNLRQQLMVRARHDPPFWLRTFCMQHVLFATCWRHPTALSGGPRPPRHSRPLPPFLPRPTLCADSLACWTCRHVQALRERLKESQGQLTERSTQLSDSERARDILAQQAGSASSSADDHRKLVGELRAAQSTANHAEARALELERKLDVSSAKASELQAQLTARLNELKAAQGLAAHADEAANLRVQLQQALDQLAKLKRETDESSRGVRDAYERAERAEAASREQQAELQRARQAAQRAAQQAGAESSAEVLRLQGELREAQRLASLANEHSDAASAAAQAAASAAAREEVRQAKEDARLSERDLRGQLAALEAKLSNTEAKAQEAHSAKSSAQQRAEELAAAHAHAEAAKAELELRHAGAAERAKADSGKAANELRYALRGKDKEMERLLAELAAAKEAAARDVAAAIAHGKAMTKEAEGRADRAVAETKDAHAKISKLQAELAALRSELTSREKEMISLRDQARAASANGGRGGGADDARRQAEREAAARAQAEARLKEVKERLEKQQQKHDEQLRELRKPGGSSGAASAASSSGGDDNDELRRQLKQALDDLAALTDEYARKKEAWRITALKRHAEQNKLEQALKVSQTNEGLLKKKADMLELTVLSHQKSMDKGRANIVRDQLKEHNERLEQQSGVKDLHASATQRKTFQETFSKQMETLDSKLVKLNK